MDADLFQYDSYTFIFSIPHVSHLLVYRDHWNESQVMRLVIAEVIQQKMYDKIYLGNETLKLQEKSFDNFEDSAIISLRVYGLHSLNYQVERAEDIFYKELKNKNNLLHFDNTRLSLQRNVSTIDVSIKICESRKNRQEDSSAA